MHFYYRVREEATKTRHVSVSKYPFPRPTVHARIKPSALAYTRRYVATRSFACQRQRALQKHTRAFVPPRVYAPALRAVPTHRRPLYTYPDTHHIFA